MNYCIKVISSNKLYEAEIIIEDQDGDQDQKGEKGPNDMNNTGGARRKGVVHKEVISWINTFSA